MLTFLKLNGDAADATDSELADWIISFSNQAEPATIADALRERLRPLD